MRTTIATLATLTVISTLTLGAGRVAAATQAPLDPSVSFAAHTESSGIVVDRMDDGRQGRLVPNYVPFAHQPTFLVQEDGREVAALWRDGSTFSVRPATDESGRTLGDVTAQWMDEGIHFTFRTADGESFHTGRFHPQESWTGPELLGEQVTTVLDLPGVYLAEVRDPANKPVGWMRVELGRYGSVLRLYDASLPPSISSPLALAAFQRIDSDIDWVEDHTSTYQRRSRP